MLTELVGFLKYGLAGLGLAVVALAYLLLKAEQKQKGEPRSGIMRGTYVLLGVGLLFSVATIVDTFVQGRLSNEPLTQANTRLKNERDSLGSALNALNVSVDSILQKTDSVSRHNTVLADSLVAARRTSVLIIDSADRNSVYDSCRYGVGGSNADEILSILAHHPNLRLSSEVIKPAWARDQSIRETAPDIVVIHASAFRGPDTQDYQGRFDEFVKVMAPVHTRFVIYSRRFVNLATAREHYEKLDSRLKGRIAVLYSSPPSFMDPGLAAQLRRVVDSIAAQ